MSTKKETVSNTETTIEQDVAQAAAAINGEVANPPTVKELEEVIAELEDIREEEKKEQILWNVGIGVGAAAIGVGIGYLLFGRD